MAHNPAGPYVPGGPAGMGVGGGGPAGGSSVVDAAGLPLHMHPPSATPVVAVVGGPGVGFGAHPGVAVAVAGPPPPVPMAPPLHEAMSPAASMAAQMQMMQKQFQLHMQQDPDLDPAGPRIQMQMMQKQFQHQMGANAAVAGMMGGMQMGGMPGGMQQLPSAAFLSMSHMHQHPMAMPGPGVAAVGGGLQQHLRPGQAAGGSLGGDVPGRSMSLGSGLGGGPGGLMPAEYFIGMPMSAGGWVLGGPAAAIAVAVGLLVLSLGSPCLLVGAGGSLQQL